MSHNADGTFEVTSFKERATAESANAAKVTRATIGQRFSGGIEAETEVETVMVYLPDETAEFYGVLRVAGRIGDRAGTFVLRLTGLYDGNEARAEVSVVPGSATDELAGLTGSGETVAPRGSSGTYALEWDIP